MNNYLKYILVLICFTACDSEDAGNCFQTAGNSIQEEVPMESFNRILINERIELIIKEGPTQKVVIETGKNLLNDIKLEVVDNQLIATNNNTCNFVRDYGLTTIHVTSPNITEIRNSSELSVTSDGLLTFPTLRLLSEDYLSDYLNIGDFNISVDNLTTSIVSNGISNFYLNGNTANLAVNFAAGDSRFEGENLTAKNIRLIHKSSNDILVNPQEKITGNIYSLGNVIAFNKPATVEVTEHYKGKLIFK